MKKYYFIIGVFYLQSISVFGQAKVDSVDHVIRTATDLKSGNTQDVLTSFFQLGLKDITSSRRFEFNSSLMAFCGNANKNLLVDTQYLNNTFYRNSNFGIDIAFDENHEYKNATIGFKYALVNHRDSTIFYTAGNYPAIIDKYEIEENEIKSEVEDKYISSHPTEKEIIRKYLRRPSVEIEFKDLPEEFKDYFKKLLSSNSTFKDVSVEEYQSFINNLYKDALNNFGRRGLLTLGVNYTIDPKLNVTLEYLKGISDPNKSMGLELNVQCNLDNSDTILNEVSTNRTLFNGSLGANWIIVKNSSHQSIVEFKAALTYKYVIDGILEDENNNVLAGEGTLRFRLTNNIWLPIDIHYDPHEGNVFGFLNIKTNFDAIRGLF